MKKEPKSVKISARITATAGEKLNKNAKTAKLSKSRYLEQLILDKENIQSIFDRNALEVSLVNTDADLFVDMAHHLAAMFSPDAENQYISDFGSVDLRTGNQGSTGYPKKDENRT